MLRPKSTLRKGTGLVRQRSWGCRCRAAFCSSRKSVRDRTAPCSAPDPERTSLRGTVTAEASFYTESSQIARAPRLQVAAAFHGFQHGDLVGVFEVRADGDAHADARDAHAERLQQLGRSEEHTSELQSRV